MAQAPRAVGIAWYRREDYPRILQIMADADRLPRNYEDWRKIAGHNESVAKGSGIVVIRAVIDPDEFPEWCRARGLDIDAGARLEFASDAAYAAAKETH